MDFGRAITEEDNGPRKPEQCASKRNRQRDADVVISQKPRSSLVVAPISSTTHSTITQRPRHLCRIPSCLFFLSLRWRGHDNQGLGLGAWRARTNSQGPYKGCSRCRLWWTQRRHITGLVLKRSHYQTLGSVRRVQEHSNASRTRPFGIGSTLRSLWICRSSSLW